MSPLKVLAITSRMRSPISMIKMAKFAGLACVAVCLLAFVLLSSQVGHSQTPTEQKSDGPQDQPEVLRVYTELVQTDVTVVDRQGNFVNGLKREDFELRIDGKVRPIDFFEKITAGSINEESQIAAARGSATRSNVPKSGVPIPLDRGRPIFFYVDDLHLPLAALQTTRKLITSFIDKNMGQNDEAAIASTSGQIGFLQQLTDNKTVLHAALERLKFRPYTVRDSDRPTMTEYQALLITENNYDVTDYFINATIRLNPGMTRDSAESLVNARAHSLAQQAAAVTTNTLSGLESLIRSANKLPGRKLVFFISGGFFIDDRNSDSRTRLQRITSAAARNGVVIYSMDARGLVASLNDISSESQVDPTGRLDFASHGELMASQDSLNALAADTGGKAVFNTNSLETGLARALKETSTYYLLAWKPDEQTRRSSKFRRIEVKVIGKSNLTVQVRRGFFDKEPEPEMAKETKSPKSEKTEKNEKPDAAKKTNQPAVKPAEAELRKAMLAPYPDRDIPVSLSLNFINTAEKGPMLSTALQVPNEFFSFAPVDGKQTAVVDVAGVVFDDKGNAGAGFNNRITINASTVEAAGNGPDLTYGYPVYLGPGLYQVRVGVRDEKSGRKGTAQGWIEIPPVGQLALSSLLIGTRAAQATGNASATNANPAPVEVSISHHFASNGYLRFLVFVYNAALAPADSKPDVAIQVQMVRDGQPVVTTALRKVTTEGVTDLTRLPYAAEVSLSGLPAGQYVLQVSIVDRVSKKSASQQMRFEVD
jgi:VWFA-related protein